jgi:SNF2 family DNA or RNA helicase
LRLTPELQKQYDDFEKESVLDFIDGQDEGQINAVNAAGLMNKLLQFANGAVYESKEGGERITHPIHDIKIDALDEIMDTNPDKSILVAWSFQSDRDRIMKAMSKYKPRELRTAKDINDWNAGEVRLMLAHPASAGHGLNLQSGGHIIVWFGLTWSLELYQQFNARLFRQGQTEHVIIHHLIMQKTSDADVLKAINNKSTMQNALMESVKARIEKYKFMMR